MGIYWLGRIEVAGRVMDNVEGITLFETAEMEGNATTFALTRLAAFAGMVVFAFSAIVGWRVSLERRILGLLWLIVGAGSVVWMVILWKRPTHIHLIEVFPFWLVYILLGIAGSVYSLVTWDGALPNSRQTAYEGEELLDN
jgi:drug/metabolite transporter (DMT)-like permease